MRNSNIRRKRNCLKIPFFNLKFIILITLAVKINACITDDAKSKFYRVSNQSFVLNDSQIFIKGANYWYGGHIAQSEEGIARLQSELDFLRSQGINNLRVMACSEGDSSYGYRIGNSFQQKLGEFNNNILGLDRLLIELQKRSMSAVLVLGNNWEWSGGFGQYLAWHKDKHGENILPKTANWDWENYCNYISEFYSCKYCITNYWKSVETLVSRVNSVDGIPYSEHPAIFSWELANEPRPMRISAWKDYKNWISKTSSLIKSLDSNHLITIGTEGSISTFQNLEDFKVIHSFENIDYSTVHIWPKTWQWYDGSSEASIADTTLNKTLNYIKEHAKVCNEINKPLVIEEFGLHRDRNGFSSIESVKNRNIYYQTVFSQIDQLELAGFNFWGAVALPENVSDYGFMKKGMDFSADPPQEEQGLYGVYESDTTTWKIIKGFHP